MTKSNKVSLLWSFLAIFFITQIVTGQTKASMRPVPIAPFQPGQAFWVEVRVGDPNAITNLYGISFKLRSDQASCSYVDGSGAIESFLGASPLSFIRMVDNQTVDIALSKTSPPGASGSGVIAKAQFMCSSTGAVRFSLSDVSAVDQNGATIAVDTSSTVITVATAAPSFKPVGVAPFETAKPFWVEVRVGDPNAVTGLYGISFKMKSSSTTCTYVDGSAVAGSFFGSTPLSFVRTVDLQTVDIAVSKTSPPGADGSGAVAKAQFLSTSAGDVRLLLSDVAAVDQNGAAINLDTSSTVITVIKVNQKPFFVARLRDTTVAQNTPVSFTYTASDPNGDTLSYSLVNPPSGATMSKVGVFTWKPTYTQVGPFVITAVVSDGALTDTAKATVTVTKVNQKPSFVTKLRDTTIAQNTTLSVAYAASDPNGDALTYSLVNPPAGAAVTTAGGFSWKPTYAQVGAFVITAVVSDGSLTDTAKATVTLTKVNVKPSFTSKLADTTIAQNTSFSFTYVASDPNLDSLKFSLVAPPAGATMTTAGLFSWKPAYTQSGPFVIIPVVSDGSLTDTVKATITLTKVNLKPVLNSRLPITISAVSRNKPQVFAVSVTDPNGDPVTFAWKVNSAVVKTGTDTSYTATFSDPHNTPEIITVIFSDPGGLKDSTTWNFTITLVAKDDAAIPTEFGLTQNYPNPFNPSTIIQYDLPAPSHVTLEVYNTLGQTAAKLVDEQQNAGTYRVRWDGSGNASGMYFYRLQAGPFSETKKIVLLR